MNKASQMVHVGFYFTQHYLTSRLKSSMFLFYFIFKVLPAEIRDFGNDIIFLSSLNTSIL